MVANSYWESRPWSTGVMAYWSVKKKDINPFVITPVRQYSEINWNWKLPRWISFFWAIDPKYLSITVGVVNRLRPFLLYRYKLTEFIELSEFM